MGCCETADTVQRSPEIGVKGQARKERQLNYVNKQSVERLNGTSTQKHQRDKKMEEYEQKLKKMEEILQRQQSKLKLQSLQKMKVQQQLSRTKQTLNRTNNEAQQLQLNFKQAQRQRQHQRLRINQEKQRMLKQYQDKNRLIQEKQRSIPFTVKSLVENQVSQLRREQERKLASFRNEIQQKQRELQSVKAQLRDENSKSKQIQAKLRSEVSANSTKLASLKQESLRLQQQLQQQRSASNLKNQRLQEVRFNELFQNQIFVGRSFDKQYLTISLQERYNRRIVRTKLVYRFEQHNKVNFHKYIDELANIAVIIRLRNGYYLAGFTEGPFRPKVVADRDALLISLTNKKIFYLAEQNRRGITYDDYYIIFGNSELRLRSQQSRVFSNFGISNGYFTSRGESINTLLGEGNKREVDLDYYEIYQVFFDSI